MKISCCSSPATGFLLLLSIASPAHGQGTSSSSFYFPEALKRTICSISNSWCMWYLYNVPMGTDYTQVSSIDHLQSNNIDYWCMKGQDPDLCTCPDPLVATPQVGFRDNWHEVQQSHAARAAAAGATNDVDVVFFGDSITEGWEEVFWAKSVSQKLGPSLEVWNKYFSKEHGAKYEGLPLGIAADTTANLLWRLENGELPDSLNPSVFWILIGTNDFKTECSTETITMGIVRIVEEILAHKPESTVVINEIFPRSKPYNQDGYVYVLTEPETGLEEHQPILHLYIEAINNNLMAYAEARGENVEFFSMDVFWVDPNDHGRTSRQINTELVPDLLHPIAAGYELWAKAIVAKLDEILGG